MQTFDERILFNDLNRETKKEDLLKTLRSVMDAGFDYVNIDLMFSLEGQTIESILEDMQNSHRTGCSGDSPFTH